MPICMDYGSELLYCLCWTPDREAHIAGFRSRVIRKYVLQLTISPLSTADLNGTWYQMQCTLIAGFVCQIEPGE